MSEERFLSLGDVAARLNVSEQTIRRWVKSGRLKAYKPGLEWRIAPEDLDEFLEARSSPKPQASPSLEPTFNDVLGEERRSEILGSLRPLFEPAELNEAGVATLLQLNEELTDELEALRQDDAEEIKQALITAIRARLLEITYAINRFEPKETAGSARRRDEARAAAQEEESGDAVSEAG
jgi:excisionase family DNA binding protein